MIRIVEPTHTLIEWLEQHSIVLEIHKRSDGYTGCLISKGDYEVVSSFFSTYSGVEYYPIYPINASSVEKIISKLENEILEFPSLHRVFLRKKIENKGFFWGKEITYQYLDKPKGFKQHVVKET